MLRVGVIGAGFLGRHHARIYRELASETGGLELAAVCDMDAERAREVAAACGARHFTDYRELLPLVDAVSIVTPTGSHHQVAMAFLDAGKDVLIEKPICASMEEAGEVCGLAAEKGLILQAGHIERFNPAARKALDLAGSPGIYRGTEDCSFPDRFLDVDVTLDMMIHDIDLALNAFGCPEVKEIKASGACLATSNIDIARAWVDFDNGCSAYFSASRVAKEKRRVVEFSGHGRLVKASPACKEGITQDARFRKRDRCGLRRAA